MDIRSYLDHAIQYTLEFPFNDNGHIYPHSKLNAAIFGTARFEELGALMNGLIAIKFVTERIAINQLLVIQAKTKEILQQLEGY